MKREFAKIPLPPGTRYIDLVKQGISTGTASRAIKRGYLTANYHRRNFATEGEDRLTKCLTPEHLLNLCVAIARSVLYQHYEVIETVGLIDPATTDFEDLIQSAALRCVELRSHPHGSRAWYGKVIELTIKTILNRAVKRRIYYERLVSSRVADSGNR